jgi:hypothetical protein
MNTPDVAGSKMGFCGSAVNTVILNTWWHLAVNAEAFAPAVE